LIPGKGNKINFNFPRGLGSAVRSREAVEYLEVANFIPELAQKMTAHIDSLCHPIDKCVLACDRGLNDTQLNPKIREQIRQAAHHGDHPHFFALFVQCECDTELQGDMLQAFMQAFVASRTTGGPPTCNQAHGRDNKASKTTSRTMLQRAPNK